MTIEAAARMVSSSAQRLPVRESGNCSNEGLVKRRPRKRKGPQW